MKYLPDLYPKAENPEVELISDAPSSKSPCIPPVPGLRRYPGSDPGPLEYTIEYINEISQKNLQFY